MVGSSSPPKAVNAATVHSYSERGAGNYEDPMNKNFLYGDITVRFLKTVRFEAADRTILDIGCGTGFVFDELFDQFADGRRRGIGVEPATGMLDIAKAKYNGHAQFDFHQGSFEEIPLETGSVDRIVSTLALHWVKSLEAASAEMRRVLRHGGGMDLFMIAKDDGARFKRAIVAALKKHLSFSQIMTTAALVQRATPKDIIAAFAPFHDDFEIEPVQHRGIVYGSFDDHMKWWTARSAPVIAEVEDKDRFMLDLREELEKTGTEEGISFDSAYLWITVRGK